MKTSRGGAASVVSGFCLNGNWGRMRRFDGCVQTNWLLLSEVVPSTRSLLCQFRYCSSPSILCFFSSLSWWFWCSADVLLIVGSCSLPMEMRSVLTKLIYIVHNFLIPGPIPGWMDDTVFSCCTTARWGWFRKKTSPSQIVWRDNFLKHRRIFRWWLIAAISLYFPINESMGRYWQQLEIEEEIRHWSGRLT